ncbi:MAG: sn-2 palmitoyl-lipid 9-desaturase [Thermoanaerobaculia bacterium]|jgi:stearoyl-CoA desaturase (delta-9 desaturase)|nr:sn-2 palmitoyl-lipid 9-desaturase [Thermoanaerobaculia bacterium]
MTSFVATQSADLPKARVLRTSDTPIVSSLGPEPWKSPWWKTAEGDRATLFYIILIHILAVIGIVFFPTPGWKVIAATVALGWIGGLGVTICYHRSLAHTALRLHPIVKHVLIFFAMFNGSGSPDSWTANHRQHHSKVETVEDISSPAIGGFWWAHLRWLWQAGNVPLSRWCPDLDKPEYRFWNRIQIPMLVVSLFGGLAFGLPAFFWLGAMRLVMSLHAQCFINSIAHMREQASPGDDSSQNITWLAVLHFFQGENWHRNHHASPSSARFGWKLWQIDVGWYSIFLLERLGLATSVKRPSRL